jgi:hypothetical protein
LTKEDASLWLAATAVLISLCSLAFAWMQARHSARQADAATGAVEPVFSAYQAEDEEFSSHSYVEVEMVNHNRKPILLHKITIEQPRNAEVFLGLDSVDLLRAGRNRSSSRTLQFDPPVRIAGCGGNSEALRWSEKYTCQWDDSAGGEPVKCGFRLEYSVDGERQRHETFASAGLSRPTHGW